MAIQFQCESCGTMLKVKDELAGKLARCRCGEATRVPPARPASPARRAEPKIAPAGGRRSDPDEDHYELPSSRSSVKGRSKKEKSSFTDINKGALIRAGIGMAVLVAILVGFIGYRGWQSSSKQLAKVYQDINDIQTTANFTFESAMAALQRCVAEGGREIEELRLQFDLTTSVGQASRTRLGGIPNPKLAKDITELLVATTHWVDAEERLFVVDGPPLLRALQDDSRTIEARAAEVGPLLKRFQLQEAQAQVQLLEAQQKYMKANRMTPPGSFASRLEDWNRKVNELQSAEKLPIMDQWIAAVAQSGQPSQPTQQFGDFDDDDDFDIDPADNGQPARPQVYPTGTEPVESLSRLKRGMKVWVGADNLWLEVEIMGRASGSRVKVKEVSRGRTVYYSTTSVKRLRFDPNQMIRADLAHEPTLDRLPAEPRTTPPRGNRAGGPALPPDFKISPGMSFFKKFGSRWYIVYVQAVHPDGRVRIHWDGLGTAWDEDCPRTDLYAIP
ncbi:MAG: hypothetical protein ACKV0T_06165 [Planctomycetales bacterium]